MSKTIIYKHLNILLVSFFSTFFWKNSLTSGDTLATCFCKADADFNGGTIFKVGTVSKAGKVFKDGVFWNVVVDLHVGVDLNVGTIFDGWPCRNKHDGVTTLLKISISLFIY